MPKEIKEWHLVLTDSLKNRIERIAKKKGYKQWYEYARAKLIEACDREEEIIKS